MNTKKQVPVFPLAAIQDFPVKRILALAATYPQLAPSRLEVPWQIEGADIQHPPDIGPQITAYFARIEREDEAQLRWSFGNL